MCLIKTYVLHSDILDPGATEVTEHDITTAQEDLLSAKATYTVRSDVISSVLVAGPILKAVHGGENSSIAEQDLLPLITKRDKLSLSLTMLSSQILKARNELLTTESEGMVVARENTALATQMIKLAEEMDAEKVEDGADDRLRETIAKEESEMRISRQKWRIIKGTVSGVVVGSGVDWARDGDLLALVADDDDDEG